MWLWLMLRRPMNAAKRIAETWICQTKGDQRKFIKFNASSNEVSKLILKSLLASKHVESTTHKKLNPKSFGTTCLCFLCFFLDLFEVFCVKIFSFVRVLVPKASTGRQRSWRIMTEVQHMFKRVERNPEHFLPVKQSGTGNATSKLRRNVHCSPQRRYESGEETGDCHGRVYVCACKTIGNVN